VQTRWIGQWIELMEDPTYRINRPRQIYQGSTAVDFVPIEKRA
jgi:citrate synthase